MYIEDLDEDVDVGFSGESCGGGAVVVSDAKRVLVGAGARALFYPTLLYNVVRNKIQTEFRWWDRVDQFVLLGAVPFPTDVLHLKELGVCGVVTLNESYETLVPTSLYHAHGIDHLVIPTRDYLFAPSNDDICKAVKFIHENASVGKATYVHCKAGRGRSTTIVLCYLAWVMSALDFIKSDDTSDAHGIDHLVIPTRDYLFAPSNDDICKAVKFIHENASVGKATYVHCKAGRGRSTTIVLCYLVKHKQMTPDAAYEYVKSIRPRVRLASSQWQAVQDYYYLDRVKKQPNFEPFDDAAVVLVAESDLEGYQESFDSGLTRNRNILAELSLICRAQFASQATVARLSCLWLGCNDAGRKMGSKEFVSSEQMADVGINIRVH
ncbi:putative phosphoric monoester hydrolase [Helianthus annuus]|nr:putative phosphoric monoester hydrolase [Helianthus annuus]